MAVTEDQSRAIGDHVEEVYRRIELDLLSMVGSKLISETRRGHRSLPSDAALIFHQALELIGSYSYEVRQAVEQDAAVIIASTLDTVISAGASQDIADRLMERAAAAEAKAIASTLEGLAEVNRGMAAGAANAYREAVGQIWLS